MVHDVGSSTRGSLQCDLSTESGVLAALALVRGSDLGSQAKAELRDLIFNYRASGGDPELRADIEAQLATLTPSQVPAESFGNTVPDNLPPVATIPVPAAPQTPAVSYGFPSGRPTPRFEPVLVTPVISAPILHTALPDEVPVTNIPVRVTERVITPRIVEPEPLVPEPTPVVSPPTPPVATPEVTVSVSNDAAKNRIAEIKQRVNEKVGNAVNLLDRDNAIGREYMTALLEAMKATASDGDVRGTMTRLEAAFNRVETILAGPVASQAPEATLKPTPEPDVAPSLPEVVVSAVPDVPLPPITPIVPVEPLEPVTPVTTTPKIMPVVPLVPTDEPAQPIAETPRMPSALADLTANLRPIEPVTPVVEAIRPPIMNWDSITAAEGAEAVIQPLQVPVAPIVPRPTPVISPVAESSPLKTPADLPTAQELKERSGVVDPLFDVDVDNGLEQLLSEWSLFRKSGIFGTGPKGRQHPLFVTLAPINMSLILSGRFEGATPEIRQSISDYMNGWRYEQGILHQPEETFEHYLRRVIRHIIDLQSKPRQ